MQHNNTSSQISYNNYSSFNNNSNNYNNNKTKLILSPFEKKSPTPRSNDLRKAPPLPNSASSSSLLLKKSYS
jgi:hypothetical protein